MRRSGGWACALWHGARSPSCWPPTCTPPMQPRSTRTGAPCCRRSPWTALSCQVGCFLFRPVLFFPSRCSVASLVLAETTTGTGLCNCDNVASTYHRNHDHSGVLNADGSVNVSEFFNAAADFCNGQVFGTLSCSMSIHPSTQRKHRRTFEKFLADLKYGNIVVNAATSLGFCFCALPWGAWAAAGVGQLLRTVH